MRYQGISDSNLLEDDELFLRQENLADNMKKCIPSEQLKKMCTVIQAEEAMYVYTGN